MFSDNTSEMKKLAARDFENILQVFPTYLLSAFDPLTDLHCQCAIPVFEGLFPAEHDPLVQSLLYRFAEWHALAKLRMHSDSTIRFLEESFKKLSRTLRKFRDDTCAAFVTLELPKEKAARQRKAAQRSTVDGTILESNGPRTKRFNLATYKFHAMGDYVRTIRLFGTTDSFTTQIVSAVYNRAMYLKLTVLGRACSPSTEGILSTDKQSRHAGAIS